MLLIGLVYWAKTDSIQGDIDKAPNRTKTDLQNLKSLETEGDHDATASRTATASSSSRAAVSGRFSAAGSASGTASA